MIKLPEEYKKRMQVLLGNEYPFYEKALAEPAVKAFRVNTDKIALEDFEKINDLSDEKVPYVKNAYYFSGEKIGSHPFHHAGIIYVQEPAAMAPAECIDIQKDWKVLDICAAPGGKSTQIKNKLGENGILVANEIVPSRCKILTGNIERLGLQNTVTLCMDTESLAGIYPKTFDMVMVDAPCSGEGMFRKEENAVSEWSEVNVVKCAARQAKILENAAAALKDGGYIVYSTCTFSLEENEMTVDSFLKRHNEFEILPVTERIRKVTSDGIKFEGCKCENISFARRFYPHKSRGEGQFMALLHNKNEKSGCDCRNVKREPSPKSVIDFLDNVLTDYRSENVTSYNGRPVYINQALEIKKSSAFSCGVTIGEIKKNYINPHHQFFMAMGKSFKRKIELGLQSRELAAYLHGEEIAADCEDGWAAVTVCGCTVGGAKVVKGRAKNHYPKGLRI